MLTDPDMQNLSGSIQPQAGETLPRPAPHALVSIILATYNESENIEDMASSVIRNLGDPVEVIVVDDNSPDLTWQIAENMADPRINVIRRTRARGLASAINRGIIESRGEYVGWMDSDLCHPPALLPKMLEALQNSDVVIGSRYVAGGQDDRASTRVLTSRLINRMATFVLGYGIQDYDSGLILMRREVLNAVSLIPSGYGSYFIEFIYGCCKKGLKVTEIPYIFRERTRGMSKSAVNVFQFGWTGLSYITQILRARMKKLD